MDQPKYKRVILKISGEALAGENGSGISPETIQNISEEIKEVHDLGIEIAIVVGGGNLWRGQVGAELGMDRSQADYMGMLATVINSMALQAELEKQGVETELLSGLAIEPICKESSGKRIKSAVKAGKVVLIGGGTGNPYFTTDTASSLRAIEMQEDVNLKGTRVDGIYTADPEKNPDATKYDSLTYTEALSKQLKIMDLTAFALCQENRMPIYVFDMNKKGNLLKVIEGEHIGTIVSE